MHFPKNSFSNFIVKNIKKFFAVFFIIIGLSLVLKPSPNSSTHIIPVEDVSKTKDWKVYNNPYYHFSFKYPDYLLSNFQVRTNNHQYSVLQDITSLAKESSSKNPNAYNVIFEADSWKTELQIDRFIDKNLVETNNLKRQKIKLGNLSGVRISNQDKKSDVYFEYNLFKNEKFIYNFAIISDNPILIKGNVPLLYSIISTAKFN